MPRIRRALISVSDKRGLVEFAGALHTMNVEIISTGGTATTLRESGIPAISVSDVTGFPEILNGRVKTLHPRIHAALLAIADDGKHQEELREHGIDTIDMVVVNLYPFGRTVARNGVPLNEALEQIDIGGPAMLRAAAKNFRHKAVVVHPDSYPLIIQEMKDRDGEISEDTCFDLARRVFRHTAAYDSVIAQYLDRTGGKGSFPPVFQMIRNLEQTMRYGENPHQRAVLYGAFGSMFRKLHGKDLSYNNIIDLVAGAMIVADFDEPTVAIIKHSNPCGVGSAENVSEAYRKALKTDKRSAFGGIIACNRAPDIDAAIMMNEIFTEIILAPEFPEPVLDLLRRKKDRRLIRVTADLRSLDEAEIRSVPGGIIVQEPDRHRLTRDQMNVVTKRRPTEEEVRGMLFAWRVAKYVKSNAIVYAREDRTLGIGAGQMSRVDSAAIAAMKAAEAGLSLEGSAVGSDAFFPFADGLLEAVKAGSTSVIQPGGSIRDDEVIRAADDHGIAMAFTGIRHFKH